MNPLPRRIPLFLLVTWSLALSLGVFADDNSLKFAGERVTLEYQTRLRAGSSDSRFSGIEVARLNLICNTIDNYILYLAKLNRIATNTSFHMEYAPDGVVRDRPSSDWVIIEELGLNHVLSRVNTFLANLPFTRKNDLIAERANLANIKDQLPRRNDTIETTVQFTNFSALNEALEPEFDFSVLNRQRALTLRPRDVGFSLMDLDASSSKGVEIASFSETLGNLQASPDHCYAALTANGELEIVTLASGTISQVFPPQTYTLLDMAWAPTGILLAGIAMNRDTSDREIFVFDASHGQLVNWNPGNTNFSGNCQYAHPCWSPNGRQILFTSGNDVSLIDLDLKRVLPGVVTSPNAIVEMVWAPDSRSFAFVEVLGQSRDKSDFDDRDFRGCILRRFQVPTGGTPFEETSQRYQSTHTIKVLGFWNGDRILFLEGQLRTQRVQSPLWDLSETMSAHLTPPPGKSASGTSSAGTPPEGGLEMKLDYCYVFRHLDGKFRNVYNSGLGVQNYLYCDRNESTWFVGIKTPDAVAREWRTFNLRPLPYPFEERNHVYLSSHSEGRIKHLMELLTTYNFRRFAFTPDLETIFILSNSRGPLSLWGGPISNIGEVSRPLTAGTSEPDKAGSPAQENGGLPAVPSLPGSEPPPGAVKPLLPPASDLLPEPPPPTLPGMPPVNLGKTKLPGNTGGDLLPEPAPPTLPGFTSPKVSGKSPSSKGTDLLPEPPPPTLPGK